MTISIITDSSSDIPNDLCADFGILVVPCHVLMDGEDYKDGIDISSTDFYRRIPTSKTFPPRLNQAFQNSKHFMSKN